MWNLRITETFSRTETGYSMETVEKLLNRFVAYGKILYDAETKVIHTKLVTL